MGSSGKSLGPGPAEQQTAVDTGIVPVRAGPVLPSSSCRGPVQSRLLHPQNFMCCPTRSSPLPFQVLESKVMSFFFFKKKQRTYLSFGLHRISHFCLRPRARGHGFLLQLYQTPAVWSWKSHPVSLGLRLHYSRMRELDHIRGDCQHSLYTSALISW